MLKPETIKREIRRLRKIGGCPHPEFVEELMGFPPGWTDCEHSATP